MTIKSSTSRRNFIAGAAGAAIAPFFIGTAKAADPIVLKLATVAPADSVWADLAKKWKKHLIKQLGEDRVKIKTFFGGSLGDENAAASSTHKGTIAIYGGSTGALASSGGAIELEAFELPYLFDGNEKAQKALTTLKKDLDAILMDRGFKLLLVTENGFRSMGFTPGGAGVKVTALGGVKVRSQDTQCHVDMWKAFGASPVPIPTTDVLSALQTGIVDMFDNTPLFTFAASWWVATKRWVETKHIYQPGIVAISRKVWDGLPADVQTAMDPYHEDVLKMEARAFKTITSMNGVFRTNMTQSGITVEDIDSATRAALQKKTAKVHDQFLKRTTKAGKDLLKKLNGIA